MGRSLSRRQSIKLFLVGGTVLAWIGMLMNPPNLLSAKVPQNTCEKILRSKAVVSRTQLTQLLTIPERDRAGKVRTLLKAPYCRLPSLDIRQGTIAQREVYPLEFDPKTWLVVLYEAEEYAGYDFLVRP